MMISPLRHLKDHVPHRAAFCSCGLESTATVLQSKDLQFMFKVTFASFYAAVAFYMAKDYHILNASYFGIVYAQDTHETHVRKFLSPASSEKESEAPRE